MLSDVTAPTSPDWVHMDCVVRTWITGTITDSLAETVIEPGNTARTSWLAIESQFRGNRETRALHLDAEFRNFKQGDQDITTYCRKLKGMADALRDLGEPVQDRTLVLNLLRGLNGRFEAIGLHLRRGHPFPTFLQARNDLLLEELNMEATAPATALTTTTTAPSTGSRPPSAPTAPPAAPAQQRQQAPPQPSNGGGGGQAYPAREAWWRRPWASEYQRSAHCSRSFGALRLAQSSSTMGWDHQHVAWTPPIDAPTSSRPSGRCTAAKRWPAGTPCACWGVHPGVQQWAVPPAGLYSPAVPGWDASSLASNFQTMSLQQPPSSNWYFDSGASNHMTSDAGITTTPHTPHSSFPSHIVVGNGHLLPVTSTGVTTLPNNLHLNNVIMSLFHLVLLRISFRFASLLPITTVLWSLTLLVVL